MNIRKIIGNPNLYKGLILAALLLAGGRLFAQEHKGHDQHDQHNGHDQHDQHRPEDQPAGQEHHGQPGHSGHQSQTHSGGDVPMSHSFSQNLPMNRNGSGTGWLPDASPMYGYMLHSRKWMYMFHGSVFLRYNNQDIGDKGSRGDDKIDAPNWFMGMGQRRVGERGMFRFSAMMSLDPLTVGGEGYPLLFQSGETWKGVSLVDRQHPHDLFSELSLGYTHLLSKDADVFAYLGYPGEPALGPVAFMHRVSSLPNPDAPIGHHWQDATHITFGVGTLGFRYKDLKLEGSVFTGREPDEERYGFDRPRFDSWSARLSYNPTLAWALQVSRAWMKDVHELGPREDVEKTTASVIHALRLGGDTFLNSTAVWGYNDAEGHHKQHSVLLESALSLHATTLYGKYEWVEKSAGELVLDEAVFGHDAVFPVNAVTLGLQQRLLSVSKTNLAAGVQGSWYKVDDRLTDLYGNDPFALQVYLRIYPGLMSAGSGK